jgi:3',5'-cyclic AMP phosphodiesterase CpdA
VRFIVLGDLHYSIYSTLLLRQSRDEYYETLFSEVLEQQADVVFAIGDTVDNGLPEEFEGLHTCAQRAGLKFVTVNGNHDLLEQTKTEIAHWTGNTQPYFTQYYNPIKGASTILDKEAAPFVILNTPKEKSPKDHGGYVDSEQLAWLKQQIDQSENLPLFVFGHHPLQRATLWSTFRMLNIDNSRDVRVAFYRKQQSQAFYFCGHNHANSIARAANWNFIQTAAPLRTNDFRVIDFTPEEISIQTVNIKGKGMRRKADQMTRAMGDFLKLPSKGFNSDRQLRVALEPGRDLVASR